MARVTDPRPPLPEWILECYDRLCTQVCRPDHREDSVPLIDYDDATNILAADTELALEQRDVEYYVLYSREWVVESKNIVCKKVL